MRACLGRFTVDIVSTTDGFLALVGDGVGRPPVSAEIGPTAAAAVLDHAELNDLGAQVAAALDGRRVDLVDG